MLRISGFYLLNWLQFLRSFFFKKAGRSEIETIRSAQEITDICETPDEEFFSVKQLRVQYFNKI